MQAKYELDNMLENNGKVRFAQSGTFYMSDLVIDSPAFLFRIKNVCLVMNFSAFIVLR